MVDTITDTLILGSGIAGLSTAIALAEGGRRVTVISAAPSALECNTVYAQGGIIFRSEAGNPQSLIDDILSAGNQSNHLPAVEILANEGPGLVREILIEKAGVPFDSKSDGSGFALVREGAHSEARILHRGDESGKAIQQSLFAYANGLPQIDFLTGHTAFELLTTAQHAKDASVRQGSSRCFGALLYDQRRRETNAIRAQHVVLATGGIGQLYLHNTNGEFARGDGLALADQVGCRLQNLEFVQFHPTAFYKPGSPRFLVSEAVRGEGAVLLNSEGERFLTKYLPNCLEPELESRDKVARAINQEMLSTGAPCVFLDISNRPREWIENRFPQLARNCRANGVDPSKEPVPVVPAAHYHCGGVWTDLQGRTTVENLWAVGEVASTGLHGGNRLASTSLLEGLVFGTRAGRAIVRETSSQPPGETSEVDTLRADSFWGLRDIDPAFIASDWVILRHTMWNYVGLVKSDERLLRAQSLIGALVSGMEDFYRGAKPTDAMVGLRHAGRAALRIVEACKARRQSHGCYLWEADGGNR